MAQKEVMGSLISGLILNIDLIMTVKCLYQVRIERVKNITPPPIYIHPGSAIVLHIYGRGERTKEAFSTEIKKMHA